MRLIDADALKEKAFGKRGGLIHTEDIDSAPTVNPDDTWNRWAKVLVSVMIGVVVWATIMLTVETFLRWGIL